MRGGGQAGLRERGGRAVVGMEASTVIQTRDEGGLVQG